MLDGSRSAPVLQGSLLCGRSQSQGHSHGHGCGGRARPERMRKVGSCAKSLKGTLKGALNGAPRIPSLNAWFADSEAVQPRMFDVGLICDTEVSISSSISSPSLLGGPKKLPAPQTKIMLMPVDIDAARRPPSSSELTRADIRSMPRATSSPGSLRAEARWKAKQIPLLPVPAVPQLVLQEALEDEPAPQLQAPSAAQRRSQLDAPAYSGDPRRASFQKRQAFSRVSRVEDDLLPIANIRSFERDQLPIVTAAPQVCLTKNLFREDPEDEETQEAAVAGPGMAASAPGPPAALQPIATTEQPRAARRSQSSSSHPGLVYPNVVLDSVLVSHTHYHNSPDVMMSERSDGSDPPLTIAEAALRLADEKRDTIREHLVYAAGGAREAFRDMDLSGSQRISPAEFNAGLQRLGVDWQEITGFVKILDVFKLFDRNNNHGVVFEELFSAAYIFSVEPHRCSTPEFLNHWCKRTKGEERLRAPRWVDSRDEELKTMCRSANHRQEVADERKRMGAMLRSLKRQGKSDASCRECVAKHLPRGSGPKDRQDVQTFSEREVKQCNHEYNQKMNARVRNVQRTISEMREQRKTLQGSRHKLWAVTVEPVIRAKGQEDTKKTFAGLSLGVAFGNCSPGDE